MCHLEGATTANFLADVSVEHLQCAGSANVRAVVSVGSQGANTANYLADFCVGRLQFGAIANFLETCLWVSDMEQLPPIF